MKSIGIASLAAVATAALAWGATAVANDQPTQSARIAALEAQVTSLNQRLAAPAAAGAVTPRQFKKLQADVKKLRTDADALILVVGGCLLHDNVGIARFGTADEGYMYSRAQQVALTTGLDFVEPNEQAHGYFLAINPQCASIVHPSTSLRSAVSRLQGLSLTGKRIDVRPIRKSSR
jgi:hypothetical protein